MKAQTISQFGDPTVFNLVDIPMLALKPGHVLIKVHATSVNPIDCKIRSGAVAAIAPEFPAILHGDVAGVIEAVAADVSAFQVGDEVYGYAGGVRGINGALAEFMLADAKLLARKPQSLSMLEAAALPVVALTAWEAFHRVALNKESHVLIHGGVGGVGHIAVQLAKWCGAKVYATVRKPQDFSLAKLLGADEVIDANEEVASYVQRCTQNKGFDVIFDTVGGVNLNKSFAAAGIKGQIVTTAARSTHDLTSLHNKSLSLHVVFVLLPLLTNEGRETYGKILAQIAEIADAGKLKPLLDPHSFTLETVKEAHTLMESGKAQGKIVLGIAN